MNYYNEIKTKLIDNEMTKKEKEYNKNSSDLNTYYEVGKILEEVNPQDISLKEYSKNLTNDIGKGYFPMDLNHMRKFYILTKKGQILSNKLSWSHYVELLRFDDINEINYYISLVHSENVSVRTLREKIKNNEYRKLTTDVKNKLAENTIHL